MFGERICTAAATSAVERLLEKKFFPLPLSSSDIISLTSWKWCDYDLFIEVCLWLSTDSIKSFSIN